jgi:NAD+ diphosphatase
MHLITDQNSLMLILVILCLLHVVGALGHGRLTRRGAVRQLHGSADNLYYVAETPLKRATLHDQDLAEVLLQSTTKIVPILNNKVYVKQRGDSYAPVFLYSKDIINDLEGMEQKVYLGRNQGDYGCAYVAIDFSAAVNAPPVDFDTGISFKSLREVSEKMEEYDDIALLAHAIGITNWHANTRFCSKCGSIVISERSGSCRRCTNPECKSSTYPKLEPATIMLITSPCEQYTLLGRKKKWAIGRYSCLAGFTEIGESLEQCVARETREESGVNVDESTIEFKYSQPWPFPSSLMLGFRAKAAASTSDEGSADSNNDDSLSNSISDQDSDDDEALLDILRENKKVPKSKEATETIDLPVIQYDEQELEHVRWFHKDEVKEALSYEDNPNLDLDEREGEIMIPSKGVRVHFPGPSSLARVMLAEWAAE